jgi:acetyl esterase/lipase
MTERRPSKPLPAFLSALEPLNLLNATVSTRRLAIDRDVAYGPHRRQLLDIYAPKGGGSGGPIAVFFYGGGWQIGAKRDYLFAAEALASRGITTVVPDYRLFPEVTFPHFLDDAGAAVSWVARNLEARHGKPRPIVPIGHSAGAYIAIMLALDGRYLERAGHSAARLAGAVGISGPYDFLPIIRADVKPIFEVLPDLSATQPVRYARADAPPLLLVAGTADRVVDPANTLRLAARIRTLGGRAEFRLYPGVGHGGAVAALSRIFRRRAPILADIAAYVSALP